MLHIVVTQVFTSMSTFGFIFDTIPMKRRDGETGPPRLAKTRVDARRVYAHVFRLYSKKSTFSKNIRWDY